MTFVMLKNAPDSAGMPRRSLTLTSTNYPTWPGPFQHACSKQHWMRVNLPNSRTRLTVHSQQSLWRPVTDLDHVSRQAERPDLDDNIREELSELQSSLALSAGDNLLKGDAISAAFDEDAQGMMEVEPEPNIIIPFDPTDTEGVQRTFQMFGVACQTIAAASRLVDLMPGNNQWIISR